MNRSLRFSARHLALPIFAYLAGAQQLNFVPFHSSGIYSLGEKAGWTISPAPGAAAPGAKYAYEIKKNNSDILKTGTLDPANANATIEATLNEPAMIYVTVTAEGAAPESAVHLGAAVAPTGLKPSAPRPVDFDNFWETKLQYLSVTPLNALIAPVATTQAGVELSTVQVDALGTRLHGYLAKPVKLGKFPALIIYQHAGVYALDPKTVTARAAEGWLAFDVDAHDMAPNQAAGVSASYQAIGNFNREMSYFLYMYLRDARAVDYICSRPDWDGRTLVLMGTGMGGQQSLVAAALRPQVSAVIVDAPTGADTNGELHGRTTGYPDWPSNDPRAMAAALYYDTVDFAPRIKAPVLAAMSFIDTTAPPVGIWTALNQIPGPKELVQRDAFHARSSEVLDILLRGGRFVPNQEFTRN